MLSKKILISAVLMLVCGSANAFDFGKWGAVGGQLAGTIGGAIGNTSCTSTKCGAANILSETVQKCLSNPATIEKNPNCAGAFFHQQCNPGQNKFSAACRTVANTMGFNYQANVQRPQQGRQQLQNIQQQGRQQVQHGLNAANQRVQQGRQQLQNMQQQGRQQVQHGLNAANQRVQQGRQQVQHGLNVANQRVQQGRQQVQQQYNLEDDYDIDEGQLGHEDQYQNENEHETAQNNLDDDYGSGQFDDADVDYDQEQGDY